MDRHEPVRILVAEDDRDMLELLGSVLRQDGYEVIEIQHGAALLDLLDSFLLASGDARPADLIISDVRMPLLTGMELLAGLRGAAWSTPIILITAFGDPDLHDKAQRLGAAAVLDKPFDLDVLRTLVREQLT
jgi:DNA-binding response OmpR family regulator